MSTCPGGAGHQVWRLSEYWAHMHPDAPGRSRVAPPAIPDTSPRVPAGLAAVGALFLLLGGGAIVLGLVLLVAAGGAERLRRRRIEDAAAARGAWERAWYCVTCPKRFDKAA